MKVKNKGDALASIKSISTTVRGRVYRQFQADLGVFNGRRIRISRAEKADCQRAVEAWYASRGASGDAILALTPAQLADAVTAFNALKDGDCRDSLTEIVRLHVQRMGVKKASVPMRDAYAAYAEKFTAAQSAQRKLVENRVGRFAEKMGDKLVSAVSTEDVKAWLNANAEWSATTWNNNMAYLRTFFEWCKKKSVGYCSENPIEDMEKKPVERKRVEVATPKDVRAVFRAVYNDRKDAYRDCVLLRLTLSYFCGMRTAEILRQRREDIRIDAETVVVSEAKGMQSGGAGRSFAIPQTAREWLAVIDLDNAYSHALSSDGFTHRMAKVYRDTGADIPKNAGRHSFITYHIAAFGNPHMTEGIVGTSDDMRKQHYDARGLKREGEEYFAITPALLDAAPAT